MPDGTVIIYRDRSNRSNLGSPDGEARTFLIREEFESGRVVLRGFLPEHVLANTLTCLQNQEYDLLWEQLLAERTRAAYVSRGMGREDFAAFFAKHRRELAATTNRMILGLPRNEIVSDNIGAGVVRLRFVTQVAGQFKFRSVTMASERGGLRLVVIE